MPANFDLTAPICLCCSDCYEGQGGDQGLEAGGYVRAYDGRSTYHHDDWQGGAKGFNMPFGNEVAYDNRGGGASTIVTFIFKIFKKRRFALFLAKLIKI